ncbi:MAG: hypothetical protein GXP42_16150 [Chloroflexi bacterium]|nr:hypothetical protein [Chloroflexota bacterium]
MSYASAISKFPEELRLPMLELIESVEEHMRAQLAVRREDFDALRESVLELTEAQKYSEKRLDRLEMTVQELVEAQKRTEARVEELVEAQKHTEERVGRLEVVVQELVEAQKRTEVRVEELAEAQKRTEAQMQELIEVTKRHDRQIADMRGILLENQYRDKPYAFFGRVVRRARAVPLRDIEEALEQKLSDDELDDLRVVDVLIKGRPRHEVGVPELWLAVEVSTTVDRNDVLRAARRAALMRKAGFPTIAVAAGREITQGGNEAAQSEAVALAHNGFIKYLDRALEKVSQNGS